MINATKLLLPFIDWSGGPASINCSLVCDREHKSLLALHNGLTAFDGGLRVFGASPGVLPSLQDWNKLDTWRFAYKELIHNGLVFFAEDVFGNQFALDGGHVCYFNVETGKTNYFAKSFSAWLTIVLEDPVDTLQLPIYKNWLAGGESLKPSEHLCPIYPFVVKGTPSTRELYRVNNAADMIYKGGFAYQIKDAPDGSDVRMKVID